MTESKPIIGCNIVKHHNADNYHHRWLAIDDNNNYISDVKLLSKLNVDIRFGYLVLTAPGMLRLDIPLDVIEDDDSVKLKATINGQEIDVINEGDTASSWISTCFGIPSKIVKVHPDIYPIQI